MHQASMPMISWRGKRFADAGIGDETDATTAIVAKPARIATVQ
jgi:hypothetical protein